MLRKRTRSIHQDQPRAYPHMSVSDFLLRNDFRNQRAKKNSVFSVPGLFVGLSSKKLFDCDDARSPTSPLDCRVVSNAAGSFKGPKFWDCDKVGLKIINDVEKAESSTKNIIFGPQLRIKASASGNNFDSSQASKSVPKNYPVFNRMKLDRSSNPRARNPKCIFEIGDEADEQLEPGLVKVFQSCSLDSGRRLLPMPSVVRKSNLGSNLGNRKFCSGVIASPRFGAASAEGGLKAGDSSQFCDGSNPVFSKLISASDIELSEDYTCVTSHGPNSQTTHIYGDCILGCHSNFPNPSTAGLTIEGQCGAAIYSVVRRNKFPASLPSNDFLRFCDNCSKKLDGSDIFIYRGEKAFCSLECRESEIENNEDADESASKSSDDSPDPETTKTGHVINGHLVQT